MTQSIRISSELYKKIVSLSKRDGCKINFLIDKAIKNYLIAKKVMEN